VKLTVRQAAGMLNVDETQIYRWVDADEIPFVMLHQQPRFHRLELLEWAIEKELRIDVDLYEDDRDQPFACALERGGWRLLARGESTLTLSMADLASALLIESADDRKLIRAVLTARDLVLFVVRAADGIAIPRADSPIIVPDQPAAVTLCWCDPALTINAVPTHALFLIVAPTIKQHLQLLSRLSLALHERAFATTVLVAGAFEPVLAEARRWEQAIEGDRP
jgi:nitrogen PTS system EIIA component